jgi:S-layer protein (TIGR01567 family)
MTVTSSTPLKLEEGYELIITSIDIDGNKVSLELSKDGSVVDSKVISPSKDNPTMADKTYYYRKTVGDSKDLVIIAAHFKNAFRGSDSNLATVDGLWQISDAAIEVKVDTEYDKMRIASVSADTITMDNKGNTVTLSKNKEITLMGNVKIITSDQDVIDDANPQRYYVAKVETAPGTYEIRGQAATGNFEWTAQNFAGFYYDIDDDLGTEKLTTTITEGNNLQEPDGIVYTTTVQKNDFAFADWGFYNVIGFQANKYFAGYISDPMVDDADEILFKESTDKNTLSDEQLQAILKDDDTEMTVTSGTPLKLEEGYELIITSIDVDGNKVSLELSKDGSVVDSKVISPSKDNPTMADKTYYYRKTVGDSKDVVIIAAHFKNAFRGSDSNLATVDGLWQISDVPTEVKVDTEYDKMRIVDLAGDGITMNNKDNTIILSRNRFISLMGGLSIKTADTDELKYCIYKEITIKEPAELVSSSEMPTADAVLEAQQIKLTHTNIQRPPSNVVPYKLVPILLLSLGVTAENPLATTKEIPQDRKISARQYFYDGNEQYEEGLYESALWSYNKAISIVSESPTLWYYKGDVLYQLGRYDEAVKAYKSAIGLYPSFREAWNNMAAALKELHRNNEALDAFHRSQELLNANS